MVRRALFSVQTVPFNHSSKAGFAFRLGAYLGLGMAVPLIGCFWQMYGPALCSSRRRVVGVHRAMGAHRSPRTPYALVAVRVLFFRSRSK